MKHDPYNRGSEALFCRPRVDFGDSKKSNLPTPSPSPLLGEYPASELQAFYTKIQQQPVMILNDKSGPD